MACRSTNCSSCWFPERRHWTGRTTIAPSEGTRSLIGTEWLPQVQRRVQMVSGSGPIRPAPPPGPSCGGCGCPMHRARQESHPGGASPPGAQGSRRPGEYAPAWYPPHQRDRRGRCSESRGRVGIETEMVGTCLSSDERGRVREDTWRGYVRWTKSSGIAQTGETNAHPPEAEHEFNAAIGRVAARPPVCTSDEATSFEPRALSPRPAICPISGGGPRSYPGRPDRRGRRAC